MATGRMAVVVIGLAAMGCAAAVGQGNVFVVERAGRTIVVEPYAPNIVRVTLSKSQAMATAAPGYGFVGTPSRAGWTRETEAEGGEVFRSGRLVVRLNGGEIPEAERPHRMPLDALNQSLRDHYFGAAGKGPSDDVLSVSTASGQTLLTMRKWTMVANAVQAGGETSDAGYRVGATFDSPAGEHYYGLGQQQQGFLDLRDHRINCWHDYGAIGGETVCVPFLVSSNGYGLIWGLISRMFGRRRWGTACRSL